MQNIGADNAGDAFYRYKMPKLVAKVEGRGNGIKTNIVNNVDIARALDRPPTYTLKHFGCELGAQTNFNKETGTSIVNGAHDAKKLSEVLELFIKKYVQCYSCGNPETVVKVRKECIFLKCKACGYTSDVDMRDKLTTFIVKNPPENKISKSEKKVKDAEKERMKAAEKEARRAEKAEARERKAKHKERRDSKEKKEKNGEDGSGSDDKADDHDSGEHDNADDDEDDEDDTTEWKTDMSEAAVVRRQREQLTAAAASLVQGPAAGEGENGAEKGREGENGGSNNGHAAAEQEKNGGTSAVNGDAESDCGDEDAEPAVRVAKYLSKGKAPLGLWDFLSELPVEGGVVGKMKVFYKALLGDQGGRLMERMAPRDKYILSLKADEKKQAAQLIALEHYVTQVEPERMGEMPFVLKMLFEEDLIDEDIIVAWGDAPAIAKKHGVDTAAAKQVRELSQKVLDWLQESDEDEEEE